jgi:hypothetical protein
MTSYAVTVISKSQHEHTYEVMAASADQAIDKVLDGIAYDVDVIHLDGEVIYL